MVRVSFIIPCLNSANTLGATLDSIFASDLSPDEREVIVVDNGSTDNTVAVAKRYPVHLVSCEQRSPSAARNHGSRLAQGEFLAFIDSDVILEPDWARELLKLLDEGFYSAALGRVIPTGPDTFLNRFRMTFNDWRYLGTNISVYSSYGIGPTINTAACMYRRSVFLGLGGFDEHLVRLEDSAFSNHLSRHGGVICATRKARAHVIYDFGILSYIRRFFSIGRVIPHVMGQASVSRWGVLCEVTKEPFRADLTAFSFSQKIFFWIITFSSYLGSLSSILEKRIPSPKAFPKFAGKLLMQFMLSGPEKTYCLSSDARLIRVEDDMHFYSLKSGEWKSFSYQNMPWQVLEETGLLQQLSGERNKSC
jgi:glycosyltransferase involved in cell wall biosynthesis